MLVTLKTAMRGKAKETVTIGVLQFSPAYSVYSLGGSRIFSKEGGGGGGGLQNSKCCPPFFKVNQIKILISAKAPKNTALHRRQIFEKTSQKVVFIFFLENFDQKIAFFRRALPFKISIYWRLRKF